MFLYQLIDFRKKLDELSKYEGINFAYAVFKNKKIIDNKLSEVDFIKNVSPEVIEYENKRIDLCDRYSEHDDSGKPIIENDLYSIKNKDDFQKEMTDLNKEYESYLEIRQEQINLFNKKMNEEVNINLLKIELSDVPSDFKTASDLETISFMLK